MISDVLYQRPKTYQLFFAIEPKVSPLGPTPTILTVCVDGEPYTSRFTLFRTRSGGGASGLMCVSCIAKWRLSTWHPLNAKYMAYSQTPAIKNGPKLAYLSDFFLGASLLKEGQLTLLSLSICQKRNSSESVASPYTLVVMF